MNVRIGIVHSARELDIDLPESAKHDDVVADVEKALAQPDGILWILDKRAGRWAIPAGKIAYIEVGGGGEDRRVGFGTT